MKKKRTLDDYIQALPKEQREKVEARSAELIAEEMTLRELRKARRESQISLAKKLHVKQGEISKIEHRTDMYVSTLREFVQAMGGSLDIIATFPNCKPIRISHFEDMVDASETTAEA